MQTQTVIDKDYEPHVGDVLSSIEHSLIIIENIYNLDKKSYVVNKNYNDHLFKHELLHKVITRREIIWEQHKLDLKLFPEKVINKHVQRQNMSYLLYCMYNDYPRYHRLYQSKYYYPPTNKIRVVTGKKPMVRVNHGLCFKKVEDSKRKYYPTGQIGCCYWYGKKATPLVSLINQKFVYNGNIHKDIILRSKMSEIKSTIPLIVKISDES
jgi:hypothetical protein